MNLFTIFINVQISKTFFYFFNFISQKKINIITGINNLTAKYKLEAKL